jgi:hypothetical protein
MKGRGQGGRSRGEEAGSGMTGAGEEGAAATSAGGSGERMEAATARK